jgi:hypothetical protein
MVRDKKWSDDLLIPITLTVKEPEIRIADITQGQDKMWISGVTTWCEGTEIVLRLDPDNYATAQDKRLHTWTTVVNGSLTDYRRFDQVVPIQVEDLYIGMHEIKMTVDKNNYVTDVYHDFRVTGTYVFPTPTMEFQKYITNVDGSPMQVVTTVVPTQTPVPAVAITPDPTEEITVPETTVPAPTTVPTAANPTHVSTTPSITLPLSPVLGFCSLLVAWLVCRRGVK